MTATARCFRRRRSRPTICRIPALRCADSNASGSALPTWFSEHHHSSRPAWPSLPIPEQTRTALISARESLPETDWLFFGWSLSRGCHHRFGDEAGVAAYRVLYRLADLAMLL